MRIVHLLSQTHLTGAEAHAVVLAEGLRKRGHEVVIVSDSLHLATEAEFIARPIHSARGLARWREAFRLRRLIRERGIDVVHAHSRAAVRIAWWATRGTNAALVSTVHGRQHFSWGKRLFDLYGERVIAVCGHLKSHLARDFRMRESRVAVVGNPVEMPELPVELVPAKKWLLVTRWTGPKGRRAFEVLQEVLPGHLKANPDLTVDVLGAAPEKGGRVDRIFERLETLFPGRVRHRGQVDPLEPELRKYGLVLGGGRVAIAAVGAGIPCFAFGEAETLGLVREEKFARALDSNFGDILPATTEAELDLMVAKRDLDDLLSGRGPDARERRELARRARARFGVDAVLERVLSIYGAARVLKAHPRPIPVLMYHMVTDAAIETPHRIFVTRDTFRRHLAVFRAKGMTTLGFRDLEDFREGRRPLAEFPEKPLILTFDDGYENNLTNALPLLAGFGFRAVIYLLAQNDLTRNSWDEGASPRIPLMTPAQRRELAASGVFEIGSHGFRHERLPAMTDDEAMRELRESKAALEKEFGIPVNSFAFTYGAVDERSSDLAREAGYAYAINTDRGGLHVEEDPWSVFRANVFPEDGVFAIWKKSSPRYRLRYFRRRGR